MDALTRRTFLRRSGVAGAGALIMGAGGLGLAELLSRAGTDPDGTASTAGRLVIVTLYGGNDGLNTVVPYADRAYHSARPELAYPPDQVLHLDGSLGLNRGMTGFKRLWDNKQLAIVRGVGYPKPDHSHFRSMDIWQTASPGHPVNTGWVGRWLDGVNAMPEIAVSFESVLPPLLAGATRAGACVSTRGMKLPPGITTDAVAALGRSAKDEPALRARAATAFRDLLEVDRMVRQANTVTHEPGIADTDHLPATDTGGEPSLATQLALTAKCIKAGVPTRVYSVSLGGFDTHAFERSAQERLLKELDRALTSFVDGLAKTEAGRHVTVLVYSEFGRRVRANASDGTDHGTAGPVFLIGPRVAGGFYGEQPSLTDLDAGDLKANTDFRDVFATLFDSVLDADPSRYLEGYHYRKLPLLKSE
jgi:uncharacterized protein (DUF1501 family)